MGGRVLKFTGLKPTTTYPQRTRSALSVIPLQPTRHTTSMHSLTVSSTAMATLATLEMLSMPFQSPFRPHMAPSMPTGATNPFEIASKQLIGDRYSRVTPPSMARQPGHQSSSPLSVQPEFQIHCDFSFPSFAPPFYRPQSPVFFDQSRKGIVPTAASSSHGTRRPSDQRDL